MGIKAKMMFLNLHVKDVKKSTEFFQKLGFMMNPQFSDDQASCIILGETIFAMIMTEERFKEFTKKEIVNTETDAEAIFCLSVDNREQVDEIVNKALASGGKHYSDPIDHGFMYIWGFQDVDGHLWEVAYMDKSGGSEG